MKKFVPFFLALLLAFPHFALAGGSCTQSAVKCGPDNYQCHVSFTCTGSTIDGNFTSATGMAFNTANLKTLNKYFLYSACSDPGSTAPSDNFDFTLTDARRDILGGMGSNHDNATTECFIPKLDTTNSVYGATPWLTSMTLAITGNTVASATFLFDFFFVKE